MRAARSLLLPLVVLTSGVALAQGQPGVDSDLDGVNDDVDAAPCDADISARVYVPADRTWGMLMFEDSWPSRGDFDFNDLVVAYNQVLRYNSTGQATALRVELSVLAAGAGNRNGLALRLPGAPRTSVTSLSATVGGTISTDVRVDPDAADATLLLAEDIHALFGVAQTREWVNTDPTVPQRPYVDIVVELVLTPGVALSAADAPFDLFLFNREAGTEVHRPRYRGTANMNAALYNTADDGTTSSRAFVTTQGIPFVLELPELTNYAQERVSIDRVYPDIVPFGASGGTQHTDFYRNLSPALAYGLSPLRSLAAQAAPNTSCFTPDPGLCGAAIGTGSVEAPTGGLCSFGTASTPVSSGGLWRWTCAGSYSTPTPCTSTDWVCQPNLASACPINGGTGSQFCNGSGTGFGTCTVTACNPGHYQSGNTCVAQACSPGNTSSCTVPNGTGTRTCDNLGSGWSGCTATGCNSGYTLSGGTCVASGSGSASVFTVGGVSRPIVIVPCGNGNISGCTQAVAQASCTSIGRRLVSHASDNTSSVVSLGATNSCQWSISYFVNNSPSVAGQCLVGVSNASWSSCCTHSGWHGNTVRIPATVGQQFGYTYSSNSGYNGGMQNVSGTTWGCISTTQAPPSTAGCSVYNVACM